MWSARARSATALSVLVAAASIGPVRAQDVTADAVPAPVPASYPVQVTPWRLTHYRWLDQDRAVGPEVRATTRLAGGTLFADGGCNRIDGGYDLDGEGLSLTAEKVTTRSCAEQTMVVERALMLGLERAAIHRIEPADVAWQATLVIDDEFGNEMLRYRVDDATSLTTPEWRLERYSTGAGVIEAVADEPAVLDFEADGSPDVIGSVDGTALGSTGCNGFVADFFQHAAILSLGPIQTTDAPCRPEMAAQQAAMLAVLDATSLAIELPPDHLVLTSADSGERLEFVTSAPLEGGAWLLAGLDGRPTRRSETIIRLAEGLATIFSPCGAFEVAYMTNGVLIRFDSIPTVPTDCADKRTERRLRAALRRARFVDLTRPALRLIADDGTTVARFNDPGGP